MKDEELDRLFKQKSELFRAEPSTQAWQQLEKQLQHKKRGAKVWWYLSGAAASILLMAGIWLNMELSSKYINANATVQDQKLELELELEKENSAPSQTAAKTYEQAETEEAENKPPHTPAPQEAKDKTSTPAAPDQQIAKQDSHQQMADETNEHQELPLVENKPMQALDPLETEVEMQTSITDEPDLHEEVIIRYSMDTADEEYNGTASENALIAYQEKRDLSARAVVGFLKKVKENGKGTLEDIREAKEELLSLRPGR